MQLAQRSGQYATMNVTEVYDGELKSENRVTGEYEFDFSAKKSDKIIGFVAYFKMLNGFEKMIYWSAEQAEAHGKRFSQTYKRGYGLWKDDFISMGKKTALKNLLSKWGMLSTEMQKAVKFDQAVINDADSETEDIEYVDATEQPKSFDKEEPITAKKAKPEGKLDF